MTTQPELNRSGMSRRPMHGRGIDNLEDETPKDTPEQEPNDQATPEAEPVGAEETTYKKRWSDLKRHYDSTVTELRKETDALRTQVRTLSTQKVTIPKTEQEIAAFANEYPDAYKTFLSMARREILEAKKSTELDLDSLRQETLQLKYERAQAQLSRLHPDWDEIRDDPKFHAWAEAQPQQIQSWLYENPDNAELCAKAIDLYKMENSIKTKKTSNKDNDAARSVRTSKPNVDVDSNAGGKKIWKESEILKNAQSNPNWWDKNEAEIEVARKEGRIEYDLQRK